MSLFDGRFGYRILRAIAPNESAHMDGSAYAGKSKLEVLLGRSIWSEIKGKTVIDFGCGSGAEAIEMAQNGAAKVYGIDIVERLLDVARASASKEGCGNVTFAREPSAAADVLVSIDAFEHFADPAAILERMAVLVNPAGCMIASFGPTWYHPLGGHLFSVFPWAHLVFGERALCQWRSHIRSDGAKRFSEVEGGLNQMTIRRFERLVEHSRFRFVWLEAVPIRHTRLFHNRLTREFLTAIVRCKLVLRDSA